MANFYLLPPDKFWQTSGRNLPINTTLHCNWYEQLKYFVFIMLSGTTDVLLEDGLFLRAPEKIGLLANSVKIQILRSYKKNTYCNKCINILL